MEYSTTSLAITAISYFIQIFDFLTSWKHSTHMKSLFTLLNLPYSLSDPAKNNHRGILAIAQLLHHFNTAMEYLASYEP